MKTKVQNLSVTCKASEPIIGHGLHSHSRFTEQEIRKALAELFQPVSTILIRMSVSTGFFNPAQQDSVLYLHGLLNGLANGEEDKVSDYFKESSTSQSIGLLALSICECWKEQEKSIFGTDTDFKVVTKLIDMLTAWDAIREFNTQKITHSK